MAVLTFIFVSVAYLACFDRVQGQCPNSWVIFDGSCYLFASEKVHFTGAEHFCTQHKSHVTHVESEAENKFIKSYLGQLKDASWWMGLTDEIIEGDWRWYDTDEVADYTDWYTGEPNGQHVANCAAFILYHGVHVWFDEKCDQSYHPICELR